MSQGLPTWGNEVCEGTGRKWGSGTGNAICPVCRTSWKTLGLTKKPITTPRDKVKLVPTHPRRSL